MVRKIVGCGKFVARRDLEALLKRSVDPELLGWTLAFPDVFYRELFRLRRWSYSPLRVSRPEAVGALILDLVFARLDPIVVEELRRKPPKDQSKGESQKQIRSMEAVGHLRLHDHLVAVTTLMRASGDWRGFQRSLQRAFPGPVDEGSLA